MKGGGPQVSSLCGFLMVGIASGPVGESLPKFVYLFFWLVWPAHEQRISIQFGGVYMALGLAYVCLVRDSVCENVGSVEVL